MSLRARSAVTHWALGLALALVAPAAAGDTSRPSDSASATAAPVPERVPERYERVVLRLGAGKGPLFRNVLYEGNNMAMREPLRAAHRSSESTVLDGAEVARRWQAAAGAAWAAWHVMMFLFSGPSLVEVATAMLNIFVGSFVFTWLYNRTRGSLLAAIIAHSGAHFNNPAHAKEGSMPLLVYTLAIAAVGILLVVFDRGAWQRSGAGSGAVA